MAHSQSAVSLMRLQAGAIIGAAVSVTVCFGLSAAAGPAQAEQEAARLGLQKDYPIEPLSDCENRDGSDVCGATGGLMIK